MASKIERAVKGSEKGFPCVSCGLKVKEKELSLQCEICECLESCSMWEDLRRSNASITAREFSLVLHEGQFGSWEDVKGCDKDAR